MCVHFWSFPYSFHIATYFYFSFFDFLSGYVFFWGLSRSFVRKSAKADTFIKFNCQRPRATSRRTDIPLYSLHSLQLKWIGRGHWWVAVAQALLRKGVCCSCKTTQQCVRIDSFETEWKKKKKFRIMPHKPHIRLRRLWWRRHTLLQAAEVWSCRWVWIDTGKPTITRKRHMENVENLWKTGGEYESADVNSGLALRHACRTVAL